MNPQASHFSALSGMKLLAIRPLRLVYPTGRRAATLVSALLVLTAYTTLAATRYWDGGTVDIATNGDGISDGASGIWNTTLKNWDQGTGLAHVAWVNGSNTAEINGASQTLTLGANIALGGIVQKSGGASVAIAGGSGLYTLTLNITGANTFLAAANTTTGRTLTVNAEIAGAAGKNLILAGPATSDTGTINLGGANTFSGTTSFSAGATGGAIVYLKNRLAFQNSTVTLSSAANLIFDSSVSTNAFTFGGLAASSAGTGTNLALRNSASTPIALTVGGNNSSTTYKGVLSGGGSLVKTGSGTLILAGSNTYTGNTTVSAGTLQVDGSTASPTTVNSGATLKGSGEVNAALTVAAGGSVTAGAGNITISNLTFSGPGNLDVSILSGDPGTAAIKVTNTLTISGGTGSVTLNLPTALGFNGTYHLVQFGSGPANANGFKLGTVPTLAWNQTGSLQVNGNYLDYVITATGDTTPPTLANTLPANNASSVLADADLVMAFDETVVAGSGSIELRRTSDAALVESFNVTSSTRLAFRNAQVIIQPTNVLPIGTYYVLIPAGAVRDTSGNNHAGIITHTGWEFTVTAPTLLYMDTGSPTNPLWSTILPTLNVGSNDSGPVYGSMINVNNGAVEVGLYGNRPISIGSQRIHVACHTSTSTFSNFTRWFQTDGNTHMLRVFVDDENTATTRAGTSSHTEAFMAGGWNYTHQMTYEWTARYTIARLQQGYCCFQLKNIDNDWAVQLSVGTNGSLTVNNRTDTDVIVTNPDGSAKNFTGRGFDVRVIDDGLKYKVWIDGVLYTSSSYSRPTGATTFRWGMYFGANNLNPPADFNIVLVSGAQVKSWPGNLDTPTTTITKANNATSLDSPGSWVGNVDPGIYNQALWNNTITTTPTATLSSYQQWAGLKILNPPGGTVTVNGSAMLGLDEAGVDMTTATQNLTVNCPVQMTAPSAWGVALDRTAIFNGIISGYPGLTKAGAGTLRLEAANTYSGGTTLSGGMLVANDNSALGTGSLGFNGGILANTASCTLGNAVNLNSNATVSVDPSQTLTLKGSIAGTGSLTKNGAGTLALSGANTNTGATIVSAGTLAIGNTSALLPSASLSLAGGTLLQPTLDGVVVSAPITVAGSGTTATISAPTNAPGGGVVSTLTLDSVLAGSGNVTFFSSVNQNALSTIYLGSQSTYAGNTLLNTNATTATHVSANQQIIVKLGTHNALPPTTVLTIDGGTGSGTGRFAELNLNGFDQQLAGLTNIPRSYTSPGGPRLQRIVNSNISTMATLTINNNGDHTFSGNLGSNTANGSVAAAAMPESTDGNNFRLNKSGLGTFTLSGSNTYTGATTLSAGTLALGANNVLADSTALSIGNATFDASTFTDTVGTLAVTSTAKIKLGIGATLTFADSSAVNWTGGTLAITGTFVSGGSLRFGSTASGLTRAQLALITAAGVPSFALDTSGYLISSPAVGLPSWISGTFIGGATVPSDKQGLNDDPDGDGVSNLMEYAIAGQDPTIPNTSVGTFTANTLSFTKRSNTSGLTYAIEVSTDLGVTDAWTEVPAGPSYTNDTNTISCTLNPGTPVKTFLRMKVTAP